MTNAATRRESPDLSGTHLWLVMMKAHRALEGRAIRSVESFEVGLSDFGVMEMLLHKGPAGASGSPVVPSPPRWIDSSRANWSRGRLTRVIAGPGLSG